MIFLWTTVSSDGVCGLLYLLNRKQKISVYLLSGHRPLDVASRRVLHRWLLRRVLDGFIRKASTQNLVEGVARGVRKPKELE
jgi:hypothetical protein